MSKWCALNFSVRLAIDKNKTTDKKTIATEKQCSHHHSLICLSASLSAYKFFFIKKFKTLTSLYSFTVPFCKMQHKVFFFIRRVINSDLC